MSTRPNTAPSEMDGIDFGDPELNSTESEIMGGFDEPTPPDADAPASPAPPDDASGAGNDQGDAGTGAGSDGKPAQQQQPVQTNAPNGRPGVDKDGNRIDAEGNIIAAAGRERRIFEENGRLKRQAEARDAELTQLRQAVQQSQALNGLPQQYGLQPQDVEAAMQIMGNFKKDPLSVAQWALKETLAMGYNLQQIVGEGEQSIEMQAIARMIDQRVGPVVQQNQQTVQQAEQQQAALREYNMFMQSHEHADVHEDALAKLLDQDASMSPSVAYWKLREFAARHGFDFSQELGPQIAARQAQQQQSVSQLPQGQQPPAQQPAPQQQMHTPMAPMPTGASPNTPARSAPEVYADPNDDWDTIIGESMRSAGFRT